MVYTALFNYHCHYSVLVRFPPFFVLTYDLAYTYVAHEVTSNEDEI